ncbi:unnamed protein product [Rotaria sp. Silwood2]|nr:unnamed protein product [Rotaria sp. Silwood2]CAF4245332.1 unnamed protein product [Rotaria sp. Silwood2]
MKTIDIVWQIVHDDISINDGGDNLPLKFHHYEQIVQASLLSLSDELNQAENNTKGIRRNVSNPISHSERTLQNPFTEILYGGTRSNDSRLCLTVLIAPSRLHDIASGSANNDYDHLLNSD